MHTEDTPLPPAPHKTHIEVKVSRNNTYSYYMQYTLMFSISISQDWLDSSGVTNNPKSE